ncbi:MAG TPA: glycosyltransferase [Rhizobiales bacterium]|nr:glycosyltransferase [Hyphomicrobiales bacterium]
MPVYSVLVPVYREAAVLPQLTSALARLDYPEDRLDIKLILEEDDLETQISAMALCLPPHMECLVVPRAEPKTKPRALDYALSFARGEYVTIFDAEDIPAPDQLRCALQAFESGPDDLACLQAPLDFYNSDDNWLTRQFALEYAALFHVLLPTLARFRLPLLLGGTSNHFKTAILRQCGAWDPFNVTEDADLGIRLARLGYRCGIIYSATREEANGQIGNWLRQRSRWLKGWMQTYGVHMRNPVRLWRELGPRGFFTFQALAGGMIISALVYPLFLLLLATVLFQNELLAGLGSWPGSVLLILNGFNFVFGYTAAAMIEVEGVQRNGQKHLAPSVFGVPFYWLLISLGAYLALWQFFTNPFFWEKTRHGLSPNMPGFSQED